MTNIFYGKKLYIFLALHSIYQNQKTESVYLILKNNYGLLVKHNNKNNDVSKYMPLF